jgi:hypothetical protein
MEKVERRLKVEFETELSKYPSEVAPITRGLAGIVSHSFQLITDRA